MEQNFDLQAVQVKLFEGLMVKNSREALRKYRITVEGGRYVVADTCEIFTVKVVGRAVSTAAINFAIASNTMLTADYTAYSLVGAWAIDDEENFTFNGNFFADTKEGDTAENVTLQHIVDEITSWLASIEQWEMS